MAAKNPPLLLLFFGWLAIITIPTAFFIFGWRDIKLSCQRPGPNAAPTCQISESFAMGLYTRQTIAEEVSGVNYQTRQSTSAAMPRGGSGSTTTSTVVISSRNGEVPVSRVSSNVDTVAKRDLLQKMQEFLDNPDSLEFHHHAKMHSIFGYFGAVGVAGLAFLLLSTVWYQLKRLLGWAKPAK